MYKYMNVSNTGIGFFILTKRRFATAVASIEITFAKCAVHTTEVLEAQTSKCLQVKMILVGFFN